LFGRDVDYERAVAESERLFNWMESELSQRTWLAADHATIADIAMYSYIAVANEGDIDVGAWPAIARWLRDVEKLDRFLPVVRSK
jgi:glutathione S-transferase